MTVITPEIDLEGEVGKLSSEEFDSLMLWMQARKRRQHQVVSAYPMDGRSLRSTGRTQQFNFKCRPDIKEAVLKVVKQQNVGIAEWFEEVIEVALSVSKNRAAA